MKTLMVLLSLVVAPAFASGFKVDPAVLGEYALQPADPGAELQTAQVRFNPDYNLVVATDQTDYALRAPDKTGLVYDEDDEPNCDGDEEVCTYTVNTKIWLLSTTSSTGAKVPQLSIQIITDDAFDESGDSQETTTYTLNWSKQIPNAKPFYSNTKTPAELKAIFEGCSAVVGPTVGYAGIGNVETICSINKSFKYRDSLETALPYFLQDQGTEAQTREITIEGLKSQIFQDAENVIKSYDPKKLKVSQEELLAQVKILEDYILKSSDRIYFHQFADTALIYAVNTKTLSMTEYFLKNQK